MACLRAAWGKATNDASSGRQRTVDEQAQGDGVDDDHHDHRGFALAFGAFSPGVVDEFLISASEKAAHGCRHCACACDEECVTRSSNLLSRAIRGWLQKE